MSDARQRAQAFEGVSVPVGPLLRSVVSRFRQIYAKGQSLFRLVTVGKVQECEHPFRNERCTDHERNGQRYLGHGENTSQPIAPASGGAASTGLELLHWIYSQ